MPHTPSSQRNHPPTAAGLTLKPARAILVVAAIVAALALLAPYPSTVTASAADLDAKTIFLREKCNVCHSIPSEGIKATVKSEKMLGPELPTAEKREDTEILLDYLRQKAELDGEKHKKGFKGSDEELGALVQWIESMRDEEGEDSDGGR